MLINKTHYNINTFKVFQKYMFSKIHVLSYVCSAIFIGFAILLAFLGKMMYPIYLAFALLLPTLVHLYHKFSILIAVKKNRHLHLHANTLQIYSFDEEGFELEQVSVYDTIKEKYLYDDIYSIVKYKNYYFLFINRVQAFIVESNEDEKDLYELFYKVKGEAFIVKGRNKKNIESKHQR